MDSLISMDSFGLFNILKFTVYNAIIVNMPARMLETLKNRFNPAVIIPAIAPATDATAMLMGAGIPRKINITEVAAPKVKLPSTVRSGNFATRKEYPILHAKKL